MIISESMSMPTTNSMKDDNSDDDDDDDDDGGGGGGGDDEMISQGHHLMRKYGTKSTTATCPSIFRAGGGPSKTNTSSTFRESNDSTKCII